MIDNLKCIEIYYDNHSNNILDFVPMCVIVVASIFIIAVAIHTYNSGHDQLLLIFAGDRSSKKRPSKGNCMLYLIELALQ